MRRIITVEKRNRTDINPEDFVLAWQRANNVSEVAARFNLSNKHAQQRASYMRRVGVKLKTMYGPGPRVFVKRIKAEALNALIERHRTARPAVPQTLDVTITPHTGG